MKINLEILDSAYLLGEKSIEGLRTKELVPKMVLRRRLTKAAKIVVELCDKVGFYDGRIISGSSYGELGVTENILNSIKNDEAISPTDFQNSVHNIAVSYLSILQENKNEIVTLSCGEDTANSILKTGPIKAMDGDEILLVGFEALDIECIDEVNKCIDFLEIGVALRVKISDEKATCKVEKSTLEGIPTSMSELLYLAQNHDKNAKHIVEIEF